MQSTQTQPAALPELTRRLEAAARAAGEIAMAYFRHGERTSAGVSYKGGGSPVTEADFAVDRFLFGEMTSLAPQAGWLSEESADSPERLARSSLIVVDPIDGTKAFARGDSRWAVSIALVENGRPVAGVIHAPALERTFTAFAGGGALLNGAPIKVSARGDLAGARMVSPRDLAGFFEASALGLEIAPRTPSLALRLADVAMGANDLAIAAPDARDWDIAAADVILSEAGGALAEPEGVPLTYNRSSSRRDMLIAAPKALFDQTLALARAAMKGKP
ncbi:3'(2'),5'-bisphosphate nucleotidase CysQ [Methylocystis heyeri]|uniref:3'(2'),5'-bisphosphate nucleotidase CysQ n=1 Tax=Methylocystis heyeri TaxID=391905 RepID=A0A6B8KML2_9HYPH|nr:3'(2'),5'-bisphosphate nucleotidase CysQ [Methylocystis heyeri]QGM48113.1 3'(2'),5'-bisphosphate nucleotidase CysQ [Methylocystis heyeri]